MKPIAQRILGSIQLIGRTGEFEIVLGADWLATSRLALRAPLSSAAVDVVFEDLGEPMHPSAYAAMLADAEFSELPGYEEATSSHHSSFGDADSEPHVVRFSLQLEDGPKVVGLRAFNTRGTEGHRAALWAADHDYADERAVLHATLESVRFSGPRDSSNGS